RGMAAAGEGRGVRGGGAAEAYGAESTGVADADGNAGEKFPEAYGSARQRVSQGAEAVGDVAARQKEQIAAAIEAGKQAYREEKRKSGEVGRAAVEGEES